jgi:hypothetical protein
VLVIVASVSMLLALGLFLGTRAHAKSRLAVCLANVQQINRAVLMYAEDHQRRLPEMANSPAPGGWWHYKEQVKGYLNLRGPSSKDDKVFACPKDRGYGEGGDRPAPFCRSKKYGFNSYVFNGVNLPGLPNIAGWDVGAVKEPGRTLLVMEFPAHAPLSWHSSRTGDENTPFYNDAESVVSFVDGQAALIPIYYDGYNAAYTRDPIAGYRYKYSGN